MKKINIIAGILTIFTISNSFAQKEGKLSLKSDVPMQGEAISLKYQPSLAHTDELKGFMLYITPNLNYYTLDVPLKKVDDLYEAIVAIPDSAAVIGFVFKNKDEQDANNGKGYLYILKNKDGNDVAGAYRGLSLLHEGLGNYLIGMKTDKVLALSDLELALKNHPELKNQILPAYYSMLVANKKTEEAIKARKELLAQFDKASEEEQYKIYYAINRIEKETADSLKKITVAKYSKGTIASADVLSSFSKEQDLAKMEAEYARLMADNSHKMNKDMLSYYMARAYSAKKNYDKMLATLENMKSKANATSILNSAAWPMAETGEQLPLAEKLSKKSLDYIDELRMSDSYLKNYSSSQKEDALNSSYASFADTYAFILFKEGKLKDALAYQEKSVKLNNFSSAEVNERYAQYLIANKDFNKAEEQLKTLIADNKSNSVMKDQLKEVYLKSHTETEFETLFASLEKTAKENARQELVAKMINMKSPDFSLKNLKGETVSLASLKGKVVVVDFWATWCGPCKASFPGMQKALNKYKDNSEVAFVFIDTWENVHEEKRITAVSKFIEDNNYSFNVLMDTENPKDKSKYDIVSAFEVDGIPTKFVLDKKGNIRFKAVGFSGSEDGLVEEISAMINLADNPPTTASIK